MGNIAERLLWEGFARCVDWSMAMVSNNKDRLRAAEKYVTVMYIYNIIIPII